MRKCGVMGLDIFGAQVGILNPPFLAATTTVRYNRCDLMRQVGCWSTDAETRRYEGTMNPGGEDGSEMEL
jgi:hypothetical protein